MHKCCAYTCISMYGLCSGQPFMCGGKGSHQDVFLSHFPAYFLKQGLFLAEQGACYFSYTGWPVSLQDLPVSTFPFTNAVEWGVPANIFTDSRDRNSGFHACVASPSLTKSLPQTLCSRTATQLLLYSRPTQVNTYRTFQAVVC